MGGHRGLAGNGGTGFAEGDCNRPIKDYLDRSDHTQGLTGRMTGGSSAHYTHRTTLPITTAVTPFLRDQLRFPSARFTHLTRSVGLGWGELMLLFVFLLEGLARECFNGRGAIIVRIALLERP